MKFKFKHFERKISLINLGIMLVLIGVAVFGYKYIIKRVQRVTSEVCIAKQDDDE